MRASWEAAYKCLELEPGFALCPGSMSYEQASHYGASLLALPRDDVKAGIERSFDTLVRCIPHVAYMYMAHTSLDLSFNTPLTMPTQHPGYGQQCDKPNTL